MSKREQRRAARKAEMLDAAMRIVLQHGIDGFTIARLADELGAAVGAIYRYFPSKESVLIGLQIRAVEGFGHDLTSALDGFRTWAAGQTYKAEEHALVDVMGLMAAYLAHGERSPTHHRLLDTLLSRLDPILDVADAKDVFSAIIPLLGAVTSVLATPVELGVFAEGDPLQRGLVIFASVHGLDHFRKHDRFQPPAFQVPALLVVLFRALAIGWGAEAALVDRSIAYYQDYLAAQQGGLE